MRGEVAPLCGAMGLFKWRIIGEGTGGGFQALLRIPILAGKKKGGPLKTTRHTGSPGIGCRVSGGSLVCLLFCGFLYMGCHGQGLGVCLDP